LLKKTKNERLFVTTNNMGSLKDMNEALPSSIMGISLTPEGTQPQAEVTFITDYQTATEYEEEARLTISRALRRGVPDLLVETTVDDTTGVRTIRETPIVRDALTVSEIVNVCRAHGDLPELTRNQVNHHLHRMMDFGFVHKYGTLWVGKRAIDYYRRSSKVIVITMETPSLGEEYLLDREGKRLEKTLGAFNIELRSGAKKEVVALLAKNEMLKDRWRAIIAGLVRKDVTDPEVVNMYHWLLDAYAMGSDEYISIWRRIRRILFGDEIEE
jgi:hypothetical protein